MGSRTRLVFSKDQTHTRRSVPLVGCFWGRSHPPLHECRGTLGVFFFLGVAFVGPAGGRCRCLLPELSRLWCQFCSLGMPRVSEAAPPRIFPLDSPLHRAEGNQVAISGVCFIPAPFRALFQLGLSETSCSAPTLLLLGSSIPLAPSSPTAFTCRDAAAGPAGMLGAGGGHPWVGAGSSPGAAQLGLPRDPHMRLSNSATGAPVRHVTI